jgi:hypothetical protein
MRIIIFSVLFVVVFFMLRSLYYDIGLKGYIRKKIERAYVRRLTNDNLLKSLIRNIKGTIKDLKYYYKIKKPA